MMNTQEMMDCMSMMGPMGWAMSLFWILIFGLLIWGLYQLFSAGGAATDASPSPRGTPLETLQRRYAEGEITTEEYEERKQVLSSE